jgi:iron complex outermembrane receptor protein
MDSRSWDDVTYKVTADYKLNDEIMIYASHATGFKPGGYGGITDSRTLAATSAETVRAEELGFKGTMGSVRLNAALFDMNLDGLQVTQVQAGSANAAFFASVDEVQVRGGEIELIVAPLAGLVIETQYTYLDATLRGYPTAPDRTFVLQRAPKHEVSIDPRYTLSSVFKGDVELGASYSYRGKVFDDPDDSSGEIRPSRSLVDAYVQWTSLSGLTSFKLWGKNLTDELYYNRMTDSADGSYANLGAPRTFGVTFAQSFR